MLLFTYITQLRDLKETKVYFYLGTLPASSLSTMMANQYFMSGITLTIHFFTSVTLVFFIHLFKMDDWYWDDDYPDFIVLFKRASLLSMDKMDR
ncbi:hypothetical protein [Lysinibacillus sp. F5]|uniref:hypothetical protein n=1 Tax=Lysinibacillus sp. F5 TaxID=1700846 RepID=UPI000AC67E7E|nr:hypothetical protein [Lysinibacillus sp. F5]